MSEHTPTPWFVSGVRFHMNGCDWHSINRYDEALKRDENVACVGYDPRTGDGRADAHFIVKAVNSYGVLVTALSGMLDIFGGYSIPECDAAIAAMQALGLDRWSMQSSMEKSAINANVNAGLPTADDVRGIIAPVGTPPGERT